MGRSNISVGFDGGGSKTACVVLDAEGHVLGEGMSGPSNPSRVGLDAAFRELAQAAAQALAGAHLTPHQVDAVCAGLAGSGRRDVLRKAIAFLAREFPKALTHVVSDGEVALEAAVGPGAGIALIAGTGSLAFGRGPGGETARAGGHGRWIGDEGSAHEMGRRAVAAVAQARDEAGPPTMLSEMIPAAFQARTWEELSERINEKPDEILPRVFPVIAAAAERDDAAAREILLTSAAQLCRLAETVARRLGMLEAECPVFKCGGVFGRSALLDQTLDALLAKAIPGARISRPEVPAAVGAARLAARLAAVPQPAASSVAHGANS